MVCAFVGRQEPSIFYPDPELVGNPGHLGLEFEDVFFYADGPSSGSFDGLRTQSGHGLRLHGWFLPGSKGITWLWCHGNAGNISHRLENLALLHAKLSVSVFIFDYRGYGLSQGAPSESGTYADAGAALRYLRSRPDVDQDRIAFFGRSLGAAVVVELATREQCLALILESPFTSIADMAEVLGAGSTAALTESYDSVSRIGQVRAPVLILHGDRDDLVPIGQGRRLYRAANEPKEFYTIAGAGHNDTYVVGGDAYFAVLDRFISRWEQRQT